MTRDDIKPVAWMYHYPSDIENGFQLLKFERRLQTYEGMSCIEEDAGLSETPLYTADQLQALIDENERLSAFTRDYIEAWEAGTGTVYLIDVARAALSPNPDQQED